MTAQAHLDTLVTVFGGSGFLGRHVVHALAKRDYRIRVAVRRPDLAGFLQPLGRVGQIHAVQANLRHPGSVAAAVRDAKAVINVVGILFERGAQRFEAVQSFGAETVARAAAAAGAAVVHVSAIGADANSVSLYAQTKARGEQAVLAAAPTATIFRPSIIFGEDDEFVNRLVGIVRKAPVIPVLGNGLGLLQPIWVRTLSPASCRACRILRLSARPTK